MQTSTAIRSLRAATKSSSPFLISSTSTSTSRICPFSLPCRQQQYPQRNRHRFYHHHRNHSQSTLLPSANCFAGRDLCSIHICGGNSSSSSNGRSTSSSGSSSRSIFTLHISREKAIHSHRQNSYQIQSITSNFQQRRHVASSRRTTKRLRVQPAPSLVPGGFEGGTAIAGVQYSDHIVFNPPSSMPSVYHTPIKFLPKNDPRRKLYENHVKALTGSSAGSSPSMTTSTFSSDVSSATTSSSSSSSSSDAPFSPPSWIPSQYTAKAGVPAAGRTRYASSSTTPTSTSQSSNLGLSSTNGSDSSAERTAATTTSLPPMIRPIEPKKYHLTPEDMEEMRRLRASDPRTWTRAKLAEKFQCSNLFVGFVCRSPKMKRENEAKMAANRARWGRKKIDAKEDRRKRKAMWGRDV